jgi:hypothetical protein
LQRDEPVPKNRVQIATRLFIQRWCVYQKISISSQFAGYAPPGQRFITLGEIGSGLSG